MAGEQDLKAQILIEAQDKASEVIRSVAGEMGTLGSTLTTMAESGVLAGVAIGGLALALGGLTHLGLGVAEQVRDLDLLASRTGVGVEALQVLRRQITELGGESESLTQALTLLNRSIGQGDPLLRELGITSKDTLEVFLQLSDAFGRSDDTAKKTEIAFQLMGRGAARMLGVMPQLAASFDKTSDSMKEAGLVLQGDVLTGARELHEQAIELDRSWDGLMTRMRASTVPTANAVVESLNDMWDAVAGRKKTPEEQQRRTLESLETQLEGFRAKMAHPDLFVQPEGQDAFVQEMERQVHAVELQIGKLKGLRAETDDEEAAIMAAFDRAAAKKTGPDVVAAANLKKAEPTEREKSIESLRQRLGITRVEAERTFEALERIGNAKFAESVRQQLTLGPEVPAELKAYNMEVEETATLLGVSREQAETFVDQLHKMDVEAKKADILNKLFPKAEQIGARTTEALAKMLEFKNIADDAFGTMFDGLTAGFSAAFHQIAAGTATAGSVVKSIWQGVVEAIIAMLARLAAAAAVLGIISLVTGVPFGALLKVAGALGGHKTISQNPTSLSGSFAQAVADNTPVTQNVQNIVVYGYDNHTITQDLVSPTGKLRAANSRLAFMGAL